MRLTISSSNSGVTGGTLDAVGDIPGILSAPDAAVLAREWHRMLHEATAVIAALPAEHAGDAALPQLRDV